VMAGIRPEDWRVVAESSDSLPATVEVVEYQGRELAVEARTADGVELYLRTHERLAPGDRIALAVDPDRLLVFPADIAAAAAAPEPAPDAPDPAPDVDKPAAPDPARAAQ
jgi:putative spermidine/putrescine transport system ATP-binding protein